MRILITGSSGMLGKSLISHFSVNHEVWGLSRGPGVGRQISCDLTVPSQWQRTVSDLSPQVIIHTAACTDVDYCEQNAPLANLLNAEVVRWLAILAKEIKSHFIYVSTDAVFNGLSKTPYSEDDTPHPINEYARSKLAGERFALEYERSLILRTNIFGWRSREPLSFGEWVLNGLRQQETLTMFTDVQFTPLFTGDFSKIVEACLSNKLTGLYHAGASDIHSKCDFAFLTAKLFELSSDCIKSIKVSDKGLKANRGNQLSLNSSRLQDHLGFRFPTLEQGIESWKNAAFNEGKIK